uniref:Uncharacterized protein n=1 Tax=Rangifer tarandus platyrhynchus TaxID=3082113 RepID=A0ACB0FGU9_RANTA|nr:unnamed protein product [Rangifer tarandus platyrhynchus]
MGAKSSGSGIELFCRRVSWRGSRECDAPAGVCVQGLPAWVASALGLGQWGVAGDMATTCPRGPKGARGAAVRAVRPPS